MMRKKTTKKGGHDLMLAKQIKDYLQLHLSDMMELLKELVNCNTSSDFKPGIDSRRRKACKGI